MDDPRDRTACPSAGCRPGAVLLGIVLPDGRIAYARDRVVIDRTFVEIAHEGRPPEQRFRFSSGCTRESCQQWDGGECGLIDRLIAEYGQQFGEAVALDVLSECPIRGECRWFSQRGGVSCTVCNVLVTDMDRSEAELPREVRARRAQMAALKKAQL